MLVGIMNVTPLFEDETLFEKCQESVSESRRERAEHYKDYRDKCRCVGAGVLLNVMLGKYICVEKLAISNDINLMTPDYELQDKDDLIDFKINEAVALVNPALNWSVTYSEKGKPEFLTDEIMKFEKNINCNTKSELQNIHFNISHSANYVACAIADTPVGIDIEGRRKVNNAVAKRYFTEEEIKSIHSDEDFFKIWTFKEALGKYTGEGLLPVIGKSEKDMRDEVSVKRYVYEDFQICVVQGIC
jgi:4'-phosphopantetheinyl transferase